MRLRARLQGRRVRLLRRLHHHERKAKPTENRARLTSIAGRGYFVHLRYRARSRRLNR